MISPYQLTPERAQALFYEDLEPPRVQSTVISRTIIDITDSPPSKGKGFGDDGNGTHAHGLETMDPTVERSSVASSVALPSSSPSPSTLKASRVTRPKAACPPEPTPVTSKVRGCPACDRKNVKAFEWQCCRMVSCRKCSCIRATDIPNAKSKVYTAPESCPHCDSLKPKVIRATENSLVPTVLRELDGLGCRRVTASHIIDIQEPSEERVLAKPNTAKKRGHEFSNESQGPKPKKIRTKQTSEIQDHGNLNVTTPREGWNPPSHNRHIQHGYRDEDSWCRYCRTVGHVIYNCPLNLPQRNTNSGNRSGRKGRRRGRNHVGRGGGSGHGSKDNSSHHRH